ncbi:MAG: tetratricopeptide repeat protein [Planctomycetota bacterium]
MLLTIWILLLASPACLAGEEPLANEGKRGLYARSVEQVLRLDEDEVDLATAALIISEYWSDFVHGRKYLSRLDDMAFEIRGRLEAGRLEADFRALPVINEYLFDELDFESLTEVRDPEDLFLHTVLDKKRGYCLSLSVLYLSLGERLGLPLYGVVVPGHFFVRYDDGRTVFNIETTSDGGTAPDEHYKKKFNVPQRRRDGIYLKNLDKIQTLGCFFNNLGNAYSEVGKIDSALKALEIAVDINPSLAESHMNLGNMYLKKGRLNDAIREYQTALQINPDDAKTHLNLGNAYTERGWIQKAVSEYQMSLKLDPDIVDTYKNLATAYCKQEMFGAAIVQVRRALILDPKDSSLYIWLGDVYSKMGEHGKAMVQYEKALKMNPDSALAHMGLGICYNRLGQVGEAIKAYKNALAVEPDMLGALVNLANAYVGVEEYDEAIAYYEQAIRIKADDATIYYNLGTAYANKGDYKSGVAEYEKAVDLDPTMGDAHNGLAYGFYRLKKYDLAWEHIQLAEELGVDVDKKLVAAVKSRVR